MISISIQLFLILTTYSHKKSPTPVCGYYLRAMQCPHHKSHQGEDAPSVLWDVSVYRPDMTVHGLLLRGTVRAVGTQERLLPRVGTQVPPEVIGQAEPSAADTAEMLAVAQVHILCWVYHGLCMGQDGRGVGQSQMGEECRQRQTTFIQCHSALPLKQNTCLSIRMFTLASTFACRVFLNNTKHLKI